MAIKGSLKEASLPDVLQLLALGQKTGCLSIADRSNFGYIYFEKGRICYASIVNRRDRLGDILVKHGKITQGQLEAAVHRQTKEHGKKLGEILVGMAVIGKALYGLITAGFVHRAGRTASPADAQMTDARVEEHRNLGIAFYKTGMLDEAAREFRRVAELRPGEANAHFYIGLVALKQARWREAMEALRQAAEKGGGRPAPLHDRGGQHRKPGPTRGCSASPAGSRPSPRPGQAAR